MTETITIGGKDYEVLISWKEATHAQLATGAKKAQITAFGLFIDNSLYTMKQVNDNNIQPLKLIERVPEEFVGEVVIANFHGSDIMVVIPRSGVELGMKFRCVQITEEA